MSKLTLALLFVLLFTNPAKAGGGDNNMQQVRSDDGNSASSFSSVSKTDTKPDGMWQTQASSGSFANSKDPAAVPAANSSASIKNDGNVSAAAHAISNVNSQGGAQMTNLEAK